MNFDPLARHHIFLGCSLIKFTKWSLIHFEIFRKMNFPPLSYQWLHREWIKSGSKLFFRSIWKWIKLPFENLIIEQPKNMWCRANGSKFISHAYPIRDMVSFTYITRSKSIPVGTWRLTFIWSAATRDELAPRQGKLVFHGSTGLGRTFWSVVQTRLGPSPELTRSKTPLEDINYES